MKTLYYFAKWQFARFTMFGKLTLAMFSCLLLSVATVKNDIVSDIFFILALLGLVSMFAMLGYEIVKTQYAKFRNERRELLNTIKNSSRNDAAGTVV